MPFDAEEFFAVFAEYNQAIWPLQIATYVLGVVIFAVLFWRNRGAGLLIAAGMGVMWLINGIGYHWMFFSALNPPAYAFGAVFTAQAAFLIVSPVIFGGLRFRLAYDARSAAGLLFIVYAMVIYPLWGWLAGHSYPAVPVFGVAPCPTTIFTIGMLFLCEWRAARWLLIVPALWSAVGATAAVLLNVPQDTGLAVALAAVITFTIGRWRGRGFARHAPASRA